MAALTKLYCQVDLLSADDTCGFVNSTTPLSEPPVFPLTSEGQNTNPTYSFTDKLILA